MNKEEIYDQQIGPLMAQILAICKEHHIAMVASFDIPIDDDDDLRCTSCLIGGTYGEPKGFNAALRELFQRPTVTAITISAASQGAGDPV